MSDLLKVKRLVDGDDFFNWRVEAACWTQGIDYTREALTYVAGQQTVLDLALVDENATIISSGVTDEIITDAIIKYKTEVLNV